MHIHRLEHAPGGGDTHFIKLDANLLLQGLSDIRYRRCHSVNVMNLPIEHGTRLMLADFLCCHDKSVSLSVTHCTHNTPRTNIKSKNKIFSVYFHFIHTSISHYIFDLSVGFLQITIVRNHHLTVRSKRLLAQLSLHNVRDFLRTVLPALCKPLFPHCHI